MIKNRKQLADAANDWVELAKEDLIKRIISFMESHGTSIEDLSYALTIPVDELEAIINGEEDITLLSFAKMLIATENVLEIRPLNQSREVRQRPTTNMGESAMRREPMPSQKPLRSARKAMHSMPQSREDLDRMTLSQLKEMVISLGLENEINLVESQRGDIIDFLDFKLSTPPMPQMPMGGMPMGRRPRGHMPMNEAPMDGMPTPQMPMSGRQAPQMPMGGMPMPQMPMGRRPRGRMPMNEAPMDGMPMPQMPMREVPTVDMPMGNRPNRRKVQEQDSESEKVREFIAKELERNPQLLALVKEHMGDFE